MPMHRFLVIFCLVFLAAIPSHIHSRAAGNDLYEKADLAVINHPDLFKTFWRQKKLHTPAAPISKDPEPVENGNLKIDVPRHMKGQPIPLNKLDSSLVQRIFFNYKKATLKPKAQKGIEINSVWLKQHPEYDILLEGHCDKRGSNEYNLALGERRAHAVLSYMESMGIQADRFSIRSWGEEKPLDPRNSESAYALNRRVEFYAIPK